MAISEILKIGDLKQDSYILDRRKQIRLRMQEPFQSMRRLPMFSMIPSMRLTALALEMRGIFTEG